MATGVAAARVQYLESQAALKDDAVAAAAAEAAASREEAARAAASAVALTAENKMLLDRWLAEKMRDAERLNEANAMYEDLVERSRASRLEELARLQVDGVVRRGEAGATDLLTVGLPAKARRVVATAHEGGCSALAFLRASQLLFSGGHDRLVRVWDGATGTPAASAGSQVPGSGGGAAAATAAATAAAGASIGSATLRGCQGGVLDVAASLDGMQVLAAAADHRLHLWDVSTGRVRHVLTGHADRVAAVAWLDAGGSGRRAASASHDRTIKVWDCASGYGVATMVCHSTGQALAATAAGALLASGHADGHVRFWDPRAARLASEVALHAQAVTSLSPVVAGGGWHTLLTCGRDNVLHLVDARTMEARATFRSNGLRVATNTARSCASPCGTWVAAGSADGTVLVWRCTTQTLEATLQHHAAPVHTCAWSGLGTPLASADKAGSIVLWE
eukprot:SM000167S02964  [mRNA]  locus=s167:271006:272488:+ [translate_table: standard]